MTDEQERWYREDAQENLERFWHQREELMSTPRANKTPNHCEVAANSSMETHAVRHRDAVDVSLYPLLEQGAAKLCQEIYEHCKFIGKSQIMEETLLYIISEDITRSEFKLLSEDGLVTSADSEGVDKGNYFYAVAWHLAIFHASRHYPTVKELYQQVAERYPTLALEHKYTKKSIVMKGDVLEVSLAKGKCWRGRSGYTRGIHGTYANACSCIR